MATQRNLFLTEAEKREVLDRAQLVIPNTAPKSVRTVKRLVWALETSPVDSRIAWLIAHKMGVSVGTYHRALAHAATLGIVVVTHRKGDASDISINWPELRRLGEMTALPKEWDPSQKNETPLKILTPLPFCADASAKSVTQASVTTSDHKDFRHAGCDAGAGAMHVMNEMNECIHASGEGAEGKKTRRGALGPGGWPERITAETLRSPRAIQRLWEFAVSREWVAADKREEFFALACCVRRLAKDAQSMKNPGGAFTTRVKAADWLCASSADYAQARREIAGLEGGPVESGSIPAPPATLLEVPPVDLEARRTRAEQIRQLLTRSP